MLMQKDIVGKAMITSMEELIDATRAVLDGPTIAALAEQGVSTKTHLYDYRGGKGVCFWIINDIANYADIAYSVSNFDTNSIPPSKWMDGKEYRELKKLRKVS